MKICSFLRRIAFVLCLVLAASVRGQNDGAEAAADPTAAKGAAEEQARTTAAAAVVASDKAVPEPPDFMEHVADMILEVFDVRTNHNSPARYGIALLVLLIAYVLRHVVTKILFAFFRGLASRTRTTLDDKLFPSLETPIAAFIVVFGAVSALKVLKLSDTADRTLGYVYTMAFSLVVFWMFLRAFNTILDHLQAIARERQLGVTPFMPWIKKTLVTIVFVFGVLMIAQSLGADVKAFLAGLGIGGLAFALAAQDTIANVFGSVVVAIDQPFRLGEFVRIGSFLGGVEDIGLRSTRLRALDKSLITIPNKTVAAEAITNLSRFTQRRVEQVIGLTYDTTAEAMDAIVEEIRGIIRAEQEVDPTSILVYFRDYSASSLDIWVVYVTKDADFMKSMDLRQRINLAIMRAVERRGLSFAFPTQTVHLAGDVAERLAGVRDRPDNR